MLFRTSETYLEAVNDLCMMRKAEYCTGVLIAVSGKHL